MSVFVPVANGLQVTLQYSSNGDVNENVFWVKRTTAWTATLIQTMLNGFGTWWTTGDGTHKYQLYCSSDVSLTTIIGRDFTTQAGLVVVSQSGLPVNGTGAAGQIQLGCTKSFTARTGIAGKNYRGRCYAVGIPTALADAPDLGTVHSSYASNMALALDSLITEVTSVDPSATLVVCSRFYQPGGPSTPSVPRAAGVTTPILSYGYHDLNVDFQRRRAPGHSRHR